jgi:protoheme IX farnesyltransferase
MKPRITLLVVLTTLAAMVWAADGAPPLGLTLATLLGMTLASGGASALNHVWDRDIDRLMTRTQERPVAAGTRHAACRRAVRRGAERGRGRVLPRRPTR